jgi:hypothetical protein
MRFSLLVLILLTTFAALCGGMARWLHYSELMAMKWPAAWAFAISFVAVVGSPVVPYLAARRRGRDDYKSTTKFR